MLAPIAIGPDTWGDVTSQGSSGRPFAARSVAPIKGLGGICVSLKGF